MAKVQYVYGNRMISARENAQWLNCVWENNKNFENRISLHVSLT